MVVVGSGAGPVVVRNTDPAGGVVVVDPCLFVVCVVLEVNFDSHCCPIPADQGSPFLFQADRDRDLASDGVVEDHIQDLRSTLQACGAVVVAAVHCGEDTMLDRRYPVDTVEEDRLLRLPRTHLLPVSCVYWPGRLAQVKKTTLLWPWSAIVLFTRGIK